MYLVCLFNYCQSRCQGGLGRRWLLHLPSRRKQAEPVCNTLDVVSETFERTFLDDVWKCGSLLWAQKADAWSYLRLINLTLAARGGRLLAELLRRGTSTPASQREFARQHYICDYLLLNFSRRLPLR